MEYSDVELPEDYPPDFYYENDFQPETAQEIWDNCVLFSLQSIYPVIRDLFIYNLIFTIIKDLFGIRNKNILQVISGSLGILLVFKLENRTGQIILLTLFLTSYLLLYALKSLRMSEELRRVLFLTVFVSEITLCEHLLDSEIWMEIRGIVMIFVMKLISITDDKMLSPLDYFGYTCSSSNILFGPWISYQSYEVQLVNLRKKRFLWLFGIMRAIILSLFFLTVSNCWSTYFIPEDSNKWFVAYKEALSFRTSHYFISFLAEAGMVASGFCTSKLESEIWRYSIVKPFDIELPTSLSVVVTNWNIPMHVFLKKYVYKPMLGYGNFIAILATFVVSSFLHGFEIKISVVLISLGLFSYLQSVPRSNISRIFDICLKVKPCSVCKHKFSRDMFFVRLILCFYSLATVLHLAYLGILMDPSTDEVGIYGKWENLHFISHIIMIFNFLFLL